MGSRNRKSILQYSNTPMLRYFILLIFIISSGCAGVSVEEQKEADFHYKMGFSHLNEGNVQAAFVELQKAFQLNPDNKDVMNGLGLVYLQFGEFGHAKDFFMKAVSVDSEFSDAHHNLGVTYINVRQWGAAIDSFKRALANPLYQTPEKSYYLLGISYYRSGQFDPAINAFKDSLKRSPRFILPYYGLALVYNKIGRYGDAAAVMSWAIEADPSYGGSREKFIADIKQKILTAKGDEERDFRDYLEIMNY
ncbi:MAG: tetratricopeptide repeat protein [Nitrospirae bacterium]|nr:tetratricopeptide repeat protein [Nitrospirota bacterium]